MTKVLGLWVLAASLILGFGQAASAQYLQSNAIALTPGASLTMDGLTFTVASGGCNYNDGGRANACPTSDHLYMAPVSGPDPSVIIEAANGSDPGVSTLKPVLSFTCGSSGGCNSGSYDLSLTLNVTKAVGGVDGASVALAGATTPGTLDPEVGGSENNNNSDNATLCTSTVSLSSPSAACNFATQGYLSVQKDFGLTINDVANGSTLTLSSITESFTPAPEPASVTLLLGGLIALGAVRRNRRQT